MNMVEQVRRFHKKFGHPVSIVPQLIDPDRAKLRYDLMLEELTEFREADELNDLVGVADALGDLLVVVIGTALEYGIPIKDVMHAIYKSNMTKLGEDGKPIYREDGKILKGPNFVSPEKEIAHILMVAELRGAQNEA